MFKNIGKRAGRNDIPDISVYDLAFFKFQKFKSGGV